MKDLLVMKFGGTSMGTAERMRVAAEIIRNECTKRPVCVVVSAMSKVTDLLLDTLRHAELGDTSKVESNFAVLLDRHVGACEDLLANGDANPGVQRMRGRLSSLSPASFNALRMAF